MKNGSILLLTKDAQCKAYYPPYGNQYWKGKMPNYEELANKGTIFNRFYTAAPSSNMSYLSMFSMKYPYEHEIKAYVGLPEDYKGDTLFNIFERKGYENHIIWDDTWDPDVKYTRCYNTCKIHSIHDLRQGVGCHYEHTEPLKRNEEIAEHTLSKFREVVEEINSSDKPVFLWCHLPHVLNGRTGYGDDMDLYDKYIGLFREYFEDDNIFISADHGNMNGVKGKVCYGFHVYESNICIPLITPRIEGLKECNKIVCNIDICKLLIDRVIPQRDIVISDSSYYAQPKRKTAFVSGRYVYIYNKFDGSEELYDIEWDPQQNFNLFSEMVYDPDRNTISLSCEYFFYPYWDELPAIRKKLKSEKERIWRDAEGTLKMTTKIKGYLSKHQIMKKILRVVIQYDRWK